MRTYYLFIRKEDDIREFKNRFEIIKENIRTGRTPVYNEVAAAKTNLIEGLPYQAIQAIFVVIATKLLGCFDIGETERIALALVINGTCSTVATFLFTMLKHYLRLRLCRRLRIEPTAENIAVMESMEYQTV